MEPLAVVTRSNYIESIHYGFICVVDSSGKVLYSLGDYNTRIFFRSSAKPLQALPLIQSGAAKAYNFSPREIAIACASHNGQKIHQLTVTEIIEKLDLNKSNLRCGTMLPYDEEEQRKLAAEGQSPTVLHCSCSGKHSAMLALAKYRGYSVDDYEKITHPVQQEILKTIAEFSGEDIKTIVTGTDGCGAPIYLLPIYKIALSYARIAQYAQDTHHQYHTSCKTIFDAMNKHPEMVAGDYEFCTELMQSTHGKLIGKVGCEAVYCLGIKKGNVGICVKVVDGNERAVYPVVMQILKELDIIDDAEYGKLKHWHSVALKNNLQEVIGEVLPLFSLKNPLKKSNLLGTNINYLN